MLEIIHRSPYSLFIIILPNDWLIVIACAFRFGKRISAVNTKKLIFRNNGALRSEAAAQGRVAVTEYGSR
jgi:hypothetical protein